MVLALILTAAAWAQDFPCRQIKVLVPYAPGGATDTVSRIVAPTLSEIVKQTVVIENCTGASGNISATLARYGMTSPPPGIEGEFGLLRVFAFDGEYDEWRIAQTFGTPWNLLAHETHIKPYPC